MSRLTSACLVNNYNYGRFVTEAVESALAQTRPFDEIIVVDDGSTDDSIERLSPYARDGRIRLLTKPNQGQLSCFNSGYAASSADVVAFLDADDAYDERYLEHVMSCYEEEAECEYVHAALRQWDEPPPAIPSGGVEFRDLGYSVALTSICGTWIGAPTSCVSLRRKLLDKILPVPFLEDWRTRADDCLVFGASLLGGRKFAIETPLVRYRYHGGNQFARRAARPEVVYRRKLAINRLFQLMLHRAGWDRLALAENAHREFQTIPHPTLRQWQLYMKVPWIGGVRWSRCLACWLSICGYYGFGLRK